MKKTVEVKEVKAGKVKTRIVGIIVSDADGVQTKYVFKIDDSMSHDLYKVVSKGLLIAYWSGMQRGCDSLGRDLTTQYGSGAGKAFNYAAKEDRCHKIKSLSEKVPAHPHITWVEIFKTAIEAANVYRTQHPDCDVSGNLPAGKGVLPYKAPTFTHKDGALIQEDGKNWYVYGWKKCTAGDCAHLLQGKHIIAMDKSGTHGKKGSWTPIDEAEQLTVEDKQFHHYTLIDGKPVCTAHNTKKIEVTPEMHPTSIITENQVKKFSRTNKINAPEPEAPEAPATMATMNITFSGSPEDVARAIKAYANTLK